MEFKYTSDPYIAKDYNGFIAPDGSFYLISNRDEHLPTHQEWAYNYVTKKTDFIKQLVMSKSSFLYTMQRLKDKQDVLIHFYGFVYYSHDEYSKKPIIILPDYDINNMEITRKQNDMLFEIMRLNKEEKFFPNNSYEYEEEEKHMKYVDDFIQRRLSEVIKYEKK